MKWIVLLLLVIGCSTPPSPPSHTLRISFHSHPTTLDPRKSGDFISSTLICMIYEGLTRCLPGGQVELAAAKSLEISPDQKTYIFTLREAYWSDGKPITAFDFEASWKKNLLSPSVSAPLFYPIKNVEKFVKGQVPLSAVAIEAVDAKTLRVELEKPTPYFYSLTAFPNYLPAPSHLETLDGTVCSGPFRIERNCLNEKISLLKNDRYWNRQAIFLDAIQISILPDETTAWQLFERGELDWLGGPLSPLPQDAIESHRDKLRFSPNAATTICTFNTQIFPFYNKNLRKAFSNAIDRQEIVEKIMALGHLPATRFIPPSLCGGKNRNLIAPSDPKLAQEYFQQALKELDCPSLQNLTLYYKSGQMEKRIAQVLQKHWKEVLGVEVEIVQLDSKTHIQKLQSRSYEISLSSWIAQFDDPISILERFKDKNNLKNFPGWEDSQYAELLNTSGDQPERRLEQLEKAEEILAEEMPLTPIYHWANPAVCSSRVRDIGMTPCGGILFEKFTLAK